MAIFDWIKRHTETILGYERRPKQLALACAIAVYVAFSPFLGFHTAMVFGSAWLLGLSLPVIFIVSTLIHNPWTMVPVYGAGYFFGQWLLELLSINHYAYNPSWISSASSWLTPIFGNSEISLLAFMIGGNILGILGALIVYPLVFKLVERVQVPQVPVAPSVVDPAYELDQAKEDIPLMPTNALQAAKMTQREYENSSSK